MPEKVRPGSGLTLAATLALTAAFAIYVLSLPIFPSNDGPVHLYYAQIFRDLLFAKGATFGAFYNIKHLLPPYSLYYYLLILLSKVMSFAAADKVVICLYMFSFSLGLRYLARSVGPNGDAMALAATPLLFNWPLFMGFVNFCLATTLVFWAIGLWIRNSEAPSTKKRVLFVVLAYVIMLTHPVPLLFLAGFGVVDLSARFLSARAQSAFSALTAEARAARYRNLRADSLTLLAALTAFVYIKLFTFAHVLEQHDTAGMTLRETLIASVRDLLTLRAITPFYFTYTRNYHLYRMLLRLLLAAGIGLAGLEVFRRRKSQRNVPLFAGWTQVHTWTCMAVALLLVMPFVPSELNGSHLFAQRLHIYVWITALVAASGYSASLQKLRIGGALVALVVTVEALIMAHAWINPLARQFSDNASLPPFDGHRVGLMLYTTDNLLAPNVGTNAYLWSGVDLFRRSNMSLYNSPWLDLPIIPIGAQSTLGNCCFTARQLEEPHLFEKRLLAASPDEVKRVMKSVDFAITVNGEEPVRMDPLLAADRSDPMHPWSCQPYGWYSFCERKNDTNP